MPCKLNRQYFSKPTQDMELGAKRALQRVNIGEKFNTLIFVLLMLPFYSLDWSALPLFRCGLLTVLCTLINDKRAWRIELLVKPRFSRELNLQPICIEALKLH